MKKLFLIIANDFRIIIAIHFVSLLLGAYLYMTFEDKSFFTGLWWAVVTSPTLGYGDQYPVTTAGQTMAMFFIPFWAYFTFPLIVANFLMHIMQDKEKFTHEEQEWQEAALMAIADKVGVTLPSPPRDF